MATTILAWNIEELGVKFAGAGTNMAAFEAFRAQLVANVAAQAQANVIIIQELRAAGVGLLPILCTQLAATIGGVWHYDWLPGALTQAAAADFRDLGFTVPANSEGYAVVWQAGRLTPLAGPPLSAGVDSPVFAPANQHFITLITQGQTLTFEPSDEVPIQFTGPGGVGLGFPPSTCPDVGNEVRTRAAVHRGNDTIASTTEVRRPCAVQLANLDVPVVVYHAPVGQNASRSPYYGTLIGFASDALQGPRAVYAGDFNVVSAPDQRGLHQASIDLGYDRSTYAQHGSGGPVEPMASVVHYVNHGGDGFRTGPAGVLGSGRDYAFMRRGGLDGSIIVYDALTALSTRLAGSAGLRANVQAAARQPWFDQVIGGLRIGDIVLAYLDGTGLPPGTDTFTALAIIYRKLISDHLPAAIRYHG